MHTSKLRYGVHAISIMQQSCITSCKLEGRPTLLSKRLFVLILSPHKASSLPKCLVYFGKRVLKVHSAKFFAAIFTTGYKSAHVATPKGRLSIHNLVRLQTSLGSVYTQLVCSSQSGFVTIG